MNTEDNIKIQVMVAGTPLTLTVPFDEQDFVRDTEKDIQDLYKTWSTRFSSASKDTLLAMMVYQYASYYHALIRQNDDIADSLRLAIDDIDSALAAD